MVLNLSQLDLGNDEQEEAEVEKGLEAQLQQV